MVEVKNSSKHPQILCSGAQHHPLSAILKYKDAQHNLQNCRAPPKLPGKSSQSRSHHPNIFAIAVSVESLEFNPKTRPSPQSLGFKGTIHLIQRSPAYCFCLIAAKLAAITVSTVDYCCR